MRSGGRLYIIAGVGLGLVAVLLAVMAVMGGNGSGSASESETVTVTYVRAKVNVPAYAILSYEHLEEVAIDQTQAPPDYVPSISQALNQSYKVSLTAGQPLRTANLETPGLSNRIDVGKRAYVVPVDQTSAFSGLITDDDYIDIVWKARIDLVRVLPDLASSSERTYDDSISQVSSYGVVPPDQDVPLHPATGDPGSQFFIRDDGGEFEPVVRVMLQDIRVLRVVRPGESFINGVQTAESEEAPPPLDPSLNGSIILEVTTEQAEVLTFMLDARYDFSVLVRGKGDHEIVNTRGITFEILASDADYALPIPGSVTRGPQSSMMAPGLVTNASEESAPDETAEEESNFLAEEDSALPEPPEDEDVIVEATPSGS